ncbi:serine hydrolase domain-containing protein [Fodinibius sediminis]|uniref:CubicO group peptidase, beta-lactamase class C family n=1 Tax=Fodinibius sediminis TaxID=1214077 RepID=A0A521E5W0_9BACT|nr:serine hydrolase [Fodinibius sediminis]SMO79328.1 CubicO group peptidase, beta-lactamase class C family [Fodinibius sediminis]
MGCRNSTGRSAFIVLFLSALSFSAVDGQSHHKLNRPIPDTAWQQYASLEKAGWSAPQVNRARQFADSLGAKAVMLVENGVIVTEWGDNTGLAPVFSIRKSLLSALYGIYIAKGVVDTTMTLGALGIDDRQKLTRIEKSATIADLLTARSGVYHPAAFEPPGMQKPDRGSSVPGQRWYYNNWDFNVLGVIFERLTGQRIFQAFEEHIAAPIQMQDYDSGWGAYHYQPERSRHPAYTIRMSARDLARFGLLYERKGLWEGRQLVPEEWIARSTTPKTDVPYGQDYAYGYLWWIYGESVLGHEAFFASGSGSQLLVVIPALDIVYVMRASAELERGVNGLEAREILAKLLTARMSATGSHPRTIPATFD